MASPSTTLGDGCADAAHSASNSQESKWEIDGQIRSSSITFAQFALSHQHRCCPQITLPSSSCPSRDVDDDGAYLGGGYQRRRLPPEEVQHTQASSSSCPTTTTTSTRYQCQTPPRWKRRSSKSHTISKKRSFSSWWITLAHRSPACTFALFVILITAVISSTVTSSVAATSSATTNGLLDAKNGMLLFPFLFFFLRTHLFQRTPPTHIITPFATHHITKTFSIARN